MTGQSTTPASGTQSYSYRVRAVDSVGNVSALSPPRAIDLDSTPPDTPAVPSGATPVNSAPSITFTATTDPAVNGVSSGINHYDVYRDNVKVNMTPLVGAGPFTWTDNASQSLNPASGSNLYSYTVRAVDGVGNQTFSANRVIMLDVDAPTVAIGGVATGDSVSGPVALSATASDTGGSGVASVQYGYRTDGSAVPYTAIGAPAVTPPFARSFATTGVADGRYEIRALASDAAGNTTASLVTNVLVDNTDPNTPAKPLGAVTVVAAPTITVVPTTDVGTTFASGIDHYDVYRDGSKVNTTAIPAAGPYSWSDTAGSSNSPAVTSGTYTYTVVAVDIAGNASAGSPGLSIVLDPQSVSAPTSVSATATPTNQRPQVSWAAPSATPGFTLDHYRVLRNGVFLQNVPGHELHGRHAEPRRQHLHLPGDRHGLRRLRVRRGVGAGLGGVRHDGARRSCRRLRERGARRLRQHRLGSLGRRRRLGRRALCRAPLAVVHAAGLGRRRRRHLPGHGDLVQRCDRAQRQALQLRRVRGRPRRQHVPGRQLAVGDCTRSAPSDEADGPGRYPG